MLKEATLPEYVAAPSALAARRQARKNFVSSKKNVKVEKEMLNADRLYVGPVVLAYRLHSV